MSRFTRTSAVAVLAVAGVAVMAPSTASAAGGKDGAAAYLAGQLAAGKGLIQTTYGGSSYTDAGLSADTILALNALKVGGSQAATSTRAFASNVSTYVGTGGEAYVGATAKSMIVALAQGQNPANFGGVNLTAQLKSLEASSGRFTDKSAYGDYSSGLTQALALIAEKKAGINPDAAAVKFTLAHQCADGGFAQTLSGSCTSDPDATSFTVQALAAVGGQNAAIAKAVSYLKAHQGADGGVTGGIGASSENTNSTGLAAVAFSVAGDSASAAKAANFVSSLQYGCSAPASLRGAIAYNKADFAAQSALGAKAPGMGNETRAAAQAVFAFAPTPYATVTQAGSADATPVVNCSTTGTKPSSTPTKTTPAPTKSTATTPTTAKAPAVTPTAPATSPATSTASSTSSHGATAPTGNTTSASATVTDSASTTTPAVTQPHTAPTTSVIGPKVNTDGQGSDSETLWVLAGGALVLAGGGTVAFARRR